LVENLHIEHVCRDHDFKDKYLFFRFMDDARDKGHVLVPDNGGSPLSWKIFIDRAGEAPQNMQPREVKELLYDVS